MPWWKRKSHPQREEDSARDQEIDEMQAEADAALERVRAQVREGKRIRETLSRIREDNHLSQIWGQGMGA